MATKHIKYLAKIFTEHYPSKKFGKTPLVKLLYLAQELQGIDLGYDFDLYTFGPFDSTILYELDRLDEKNEVDVEPAKDGWGYDIKLLTNKIEPVETGEKAALTAIVKEYGSFTAKRLEILATLLYFNRGGISKDKELVSSVKGIKPKYTEEEIQVELDILKKQRLIKFSPS